MEVTLHEKQSIVARDTHRFKVVAAGRRFGKSYLAAVTLYEKAFETDVPGQNIKIRSDGSHWDLSGEVVYYVGPTFKQARENLWEVMMQMGQGLIAGVRQNEGEIKLTNGRLIRFKGADDPDSLRGVGLSYVVMDEYAFMKPDVWEYIISPALGAAEGGALFIGTPDGKNHFYRMWSAAEKKLDPSTSKPSDDWIAFQFATADNVTLTTRELKAMVDRASDDAAAQELYASFEATGGKVFSMDQFPVIDKYFQGEYVLACDLAGFSTGGNKKQKTILDDHALALIKVHDHGYHVQQIMNGRWDVRETALRIVNVFRKYRPVSVGIEQGMAKNAVETYIQDFMAEYGLWFDIHPLKHGNNKKEDRIKWALQGRADKQKITLQSDRELPIEDKWVGKFLSQAVDFPNQLAHDDLIDATAYGIDQLADKAMGWDVGVIDEWYPIDDLAGY
jgi:phage terminase large subunit-like protein